MNEELKARLTIPHIHFNTLGIDLFVYSDYYILDSITKESYNACTIDQRDIPRKGF